MGAIRNYLTNKILIAALIVILILGTLVYIAYGPSSWSFGKVSISRQEKTSQSNLLFERARDIFRMVTAEYVVKSVFPHEYINDACSLETIMGRLRSTNLPASQVLTPQEARCLTLHNVAAQAGVPADSSSPRFLVFSHVLVAGFELGDDWPKEITEFDTPAGPGIEMKIPAPEILEIRMIDPESDSYRYPDANVSPAQLQLAASFVREELAKDRYVQEILQVADKNGRRFLTQALQAAGYTTIRLVTQEELDVRE
ncbi:MAG: hypothetical protein D6B26_04035 [Spirochaetaceae bacterium]|nr:MAG: hypothetical protein D6B26_04035 [Spirochaetaceae bacterium]